MPCPPALGGMDACRPEAGIEIIQFYAFNST